MSDELLNDELSYPKVDKCVSEIIKQLPKLPQVQYATNDQLLYLCDIASKLGLYDARDLLQRVVNQSYTILINA